MFDYSNIAFYTALKQTGRARLGHLWMVQGGWGSEPPIYYGAPSDEFHRRMLELTEADIIESHQLSFSSSEHGEESASILASIFRRLGVLDVKASKLKELEYSAELTMLDYTRLSVPPAAFNPLIGQPIPAIAGTGRWVIAYAQHEASQGRFSLKYDQKRALALGLDLAAKGSASLNYEGEHASVHSYNFNAGEPVVFGVSIIQLEEKSKKWSKFGTKHEAIRFVHP
ncbi:hypothetical protein JW859_13985 [bacterium]|nr:hypothetical protein [bacterium]